MLQSEYLPMRLVAQQLKTSIYKVRKAVKNLEQQGLMKLEEVATDYDEYYNGLYTEYKPTLCTRAYVVTEKGYKKDEEATND